MAHRSSVAGSGKFSMCGRMELTKVQAVLAVPAAVCLWLDFVGKGVHVV